MLQKVTKFRRVDTNVGACPALLVRHIVTQSWAQQITVATFWHNFEAKNVSAVKLPQNIVFKLRFNSEGQTIFRMLACLSNLTTLSHWRYNYWRMPSSGVMHSITVVCSKIVLYSSCLKTPFVQLVKQSR